MFQTCARLRSSYQKKIRQGIKVAPLRFCNAADSHRTEFTPPRQFERAGFSSTTTPIKYGASVRVFPRALNPPLPLLNRPRPRFVFCLCSCNEHPTTASAAIPAPLKNKNTTETAPIMARQNAPNRRLRCGPSSPAASKSCRGESPLQHFFTLASTITLANLVTWRLT
jgi:hypothetical protein